MTYPMMLRDNALIRVQVKKESMIELPENIRVQEKLSATTGEIVAVGPECEMVKVGDSVFYKQYVGNVLDFDGVPSDDLFVVVSENDIIGIYPRKKAHETH